MKEWSYLWTRSSWFLGLSFDFLDLFGSSIYFRRYFRFNIRIQYSDYLMIQFISLFTWSPDRVEPCVLLASGFSSSWYHPMWRQRSHVEIWPLCAISFWSQPRPIIIQNIFFQYCLYLIDIWFEKKKKNFLLGLSCAYVGTRRSSWFFLDYAWNWMMPRIFYSRK